MNFKPELAEAVLAGRKTVTRRLVSENPRSPWFKGRCALQVGRTYAVCPGRGKPAIGRVLVRHVDQQRLGDPFGLTLGDRLEGDACAQEAAFREGFESVVAFKLAWLKINGTYDPDARVWRVEFELHDGRSGWWSVEDGAGTCSRCGNGGPREDHGPDRCPLIYWESWSSAPSRRESLC